MGGIYSMYRGEDKCIQTFVGEICRDESTSKTLAYVKNSIKIREEV
jgi:hypothetical protein